jgi:hypothetical protein
MDEAWLWRIGGTFHLSPPPGPVASLSHGNCCVVLSIFA